MNENLRHAIAYEKLLSEKEALEAKCNQFKEAFKKQCLFSAELESRLAEAEKVIDELLGMPKNPEWGFAHNMGRRLKEALRGGAK